MKKATIRQPDMAFSGRLKLPICRLGGGCVIQLRYENIVE